MFVKGMKATHKCRKMKTEKSLTRLRRCWKDQKISSQFQRNKEPVTITPLKFEELMEYMNEWLNHPLFPQLFDNGNFKVEED